MKPRNELKDKLSDALLEHAATPDGRDLLTRMADAYVRDMSDDAFRDYAHHYLTEEERE
jgi:hypothetical protein